MSALLNVTYKPQIEGCHRIYFKNSGETYCLYIDNSASVIGENKTVTIDLEGYSTCIDPLPQQISCTTNLDIVGYIQPCCVEEGSDDLTVNFTAEYSNAVCTPYSVECVETGCSIITISKTGPDIPYDEDAPFYPPIVTVTSSCGGTGASVYPVLTSGIDGAFISAIVIDNGGIGYCDIECITVSITANKDGDSQEAQVSFVSPSIDCGSFRKRDCLGNPELTSYTLDPGLSTVICSGPTGPINVNDSTYVFTEITDETVSCCQCVKYEVINISEDTSYLVNYTDCSDQQLKTFTIDPGQTIETCSVQGSIWVADKTASQYVEVVYSGIQDC